MRDIQAAAVALAVAIAGCEARPAFEVPPGPPRSVAIDVLLPVDVVGTYRVDGFREALRLELAKYRVGLLPPPAPAGTPKVRIDLGQFTYSDWQEIDVTLVNPDGAERRAGSVRVPDAGGFSIEAAAEPVAAIVARSVWALPAPR